MDGSFRKKLIWSLWTLTVAGLYAGYFDRSYWTWVIAFTAVHALVFVALVGFRPMAFPAQLRIAYVLWLVVGTYVPTMEWMMYVTTAGATANQLFGYCPLSRLLYLLPWNRNHPMSLRTFSRTFLTGPVAGRFRLAPALP